MCFGRKVCKNNSYFFLQRLNMKRKHIKFTRFKNYFIYIQTSFFMLMFVLLVYQPVNIHKKL